MKLSDIKNGNLSAEWAEKGYELPKFDIEAVKAKTHAEPTWVHFGAGNIFRAFPAAVLNDALNSGKYDRGVIVAESFDYEIIDKAYQPYDNLSLLVCLKSTGEIEKKVIASVTESLKADYSFGADWARLVEIFQNPSLQMISFTITEKGYGVAPADLERGLTPVLAMGKVTALLYERFKAGKLPLTVQSMDNCSHNGDKVKTAVHAYAAKWVEQGLVPAEFLAYVQDETKITFPWSMIDKITPRPDAKVQDMLAKDGFEDNYTIVTEKHTFTAPFVNAEETQYLCIEDHYTNGRPPLELGGVLYCDRETVDKIEKMKVCTCLNPLHTAMSIYGCMLDYTLISAEMADEDLRPFIQKIGYIEAMPVVVDPGVLNPYEFIGAVINRRLPNPFMPDAPQRIATDTSQKLAIRFGETIKAYQARGLDKSNLVLIPLVLAGYARYLKGIDDNGKAFEISPDPLLAELQAIVAPLEVKEGEQPIVSSRYSIVIAAAKRARQIIAGAESAVPDYKNKKPLSVAVEELMDGDVKILSSGEDADDEDDKPSIGGDVYDIALDVDDEDIFEDEMKEDSDEDSEDEDDEEKESESDEDMSSEEDDYE